MKKQLLNLSLLFLFFSLNAQDSKPVIGVAPFSFSRQTVEQGFAEEIFNYVVNALEQTRRFRVMDRMYGAQVITVEKELNKGSDFVDGSAVEQGKQIGAEYMVFGRVNSASCIRSTSGNYEGNISLFLRIYDVESGEVIASEIIFPNGRSELKEFIYSKPGESLEGFLSRASANKIPSFLKPLLAGTTTSCEEALKIAREKIQPEISSFVQDKFPMELNIFRIQNDEIKVIGSEEMGLNVGTKLEVFKIEKIKVGQRTLTDEQKLGQIKIICFSGDFVTCEFVEGKAQIQNAFTLSPKDIKLVTIASPKRKSLLGSILNK